MEQNFQTERESFSVQMREVKTKYESEKSELIQILEQQSKGEVQSNSKTSQIKVLEKQLEDHVSSFSKLTQKYEKLTVEIS